MAVLLQPGQGIVSPEAPTQTFKEYPKLMTHPAAKAGDPGPELKSAAGFTHYNGTAIRFAPVLVTNRDQEEYHASQGYEAKAVPDAAVAFQREINALNSGTTTAIMENYTPVQYPKWSAVLNRNVNSPEEEAHFLAIREVGQTSPTPAPATISTESREERKARLLRELEELESAEAVEELAAKGAIGASEISAIEPTVDVEVNTLGAWRERQAAAPAPPADRPLTQVEKMRLGKQRKAAERAIAEGMRILTGTPK